MPPRLLPALTSAAMLAIATMAHASPSAAAFDAYYRQLDDGEIPIGEERQSADAMRTLRSLLPPGDAPRERRYHSAACALDFRHDAKGELADALRGIAEARRVGDVDAEARFELCRGYAFEMLDEKRALEAYDRALAIGTRLEDPRLVGDAYTLRGGVRSLLGDQARALGDFLAAQALFDRARLTRRSEANLLNIGTAYRRMGLYAQGLAYLRDSEAYARRVDSQPDLFSALMQLGYAYEEQRQGAPAVHAFEQALDIAQHTDRIDRGYARLGLANAWLAAGDASRALGSVALARQELAVDGNAAREPMLDQAEALALARLGRHAAAVALFDRAEPLMRAQDNLRYLADLHRARAASEEALGNAPAALADLRAYDALATRLREARDDQRVDLWRQAFDAHRRTLERSRLDLERRLREQQIRALEGERPWRVLALVLGLLLLAVLAGFALLQRREAGRLRRLALTDALTGLANRRAILGHAQAALDDAAQADRPLSLVMLDLDHFKRVNDAHGHATGDAVLRRAARAFASVLRRRDALGRSGGEEFLAVLPDTDRDGAEAIAERLRLVLASLDAAPVVPGLAVRVSAGVATGRAGETRLGDLLRRADAALYRAKTAGRNRVACAD